MTPFTSLLLIAAAKASALTPAKVTDVVAAAVTCFNAVEREAVNAATLNNDGWSERLNSVGKPETPGGHLFVKNGVSAQIAAVGPVCSLVAPVESFDDVQATLMQLDDAIHPEKIVEEKAGIRLTKGSKTALFFVGKVTTQKPAGVRIDTQFSESN